MSLIDNSLENVIQDLLRRIKALETKSVDVDTLSDLSPDLGVMLAGEFRSPTDPLNPIEPGEGFTGVRMSGQGMPYGGTDYAIAGVVNDVLQFGLALEDGKAVAGGGEVTMDVDGITFVLPVPATTDQSSIKWKTGTITPTKISSWADDADSTTNISVGSQGIAAYPTGDTILSAKDATGTHQALMYLEGNATQSYIGMFADTIELTAPSIKLNGEDANISSGTWTPSIRGSTTPGTYQLNAAGMLANYVKIGKVVHLEALIPLASVVTGGGTGYCLVTGLPFTKMAGSSPVGSIRLSGIPLAGAYATVGFVTGNASAALAIYETITNAAQAAMPITSIGANDQIAFSISYITG